MGQHPKISNEAWVMPQATEMIAKLKEANLFGVSELQDRFLMHFVESVAGKQLNHPELDLTQAWDWGLPTVFLEGGTFKPNADQALYYSLYYDQHFDGVIDAIVSDEALTEHIKLFRLGWLVPRRQ